MLGKKKQEEQGHSGTVVLSKKTYSFQFNLIILKNDHFSIKKMHFYLKNGKYKLCNFEF